MEYRSERLLIRPLRADDTDLLQDYFRRNAEFLRPWEPAREDAYYSRDSLERMIRAEAVARESRAALHLYLFPAEEQRIIGFAGLSQIIYGSFLSCFLGYKLDQREINKGYMTEALRIVIGIAFGEYGLHRIESNIIPTNTASIRVMEKLGFQREGMSRKYLKINGRWQDHIHYVLLNEGLE